ncbi:hypothetical protein AVEN_76017-1 [Araneus ventricosus]|uniref:Uncharacterized protein n=1 Tax=Araneus ventricosus TaxID=182803 RepID=A0A4Y2VAJ5_ARAVE|nr:hypothetical protein AVEN_76017-1 [Araneus ventricosus]
MALRVALGLPKWTPNIVLMKIAGQEVLSQKVKRLAAQFFIRQLANGAQSPIYDQNCKPSIKLIKKDEVLLANPDSNFSLQQACHKFVMTRVQVCHKFVMTRAQACSKLTAS